MGKYSYSTSVLEKIDRICKDPAVEIVSAFPSHNLLIDEIEKFIKDIVTFIGESYTETGTVQYVIEMSFKTAKGEKISTAVILNELKSDNNVFSVDSSLNITEISRLAEVSDSHLSKHSRDKKKVLFFITNGLDVKIYCQGITIHELNVRNPDAAPRVSKKFARVARDYRYSLMDFYQERVKLNVTDHWQKQSTRTLKGGKTEDIFQNSLANWLHENIIASRIIPKVKKISRDETDIEIIEHGGNSYLIEIKWLGKNNSGTSYSETRVRDAIDQVKNYLDIDKEVLEATLVVYDGRADTEFDKLVFVDEEKGSWKEIEECLTKKLPEKGKGLIYYLISGTASSRKSL